MKMLRQHLSSRPRRRRPDFDSLEGRALLAVPGLTLSLGSTSVTGNSGANALSGTVARSNADNALPLTVALTSSNPNSIAVPATVVIPAGQTSASFSASAPAGGSAPGSKTVTISAAASAEVPLALDTSFRVTTPQTMNDAVAVQPDGKVVTVGSYYTGDSQTLYRMTVARLLPDGTPDQSFNNGSPAFAGTIGQAWQAQAVVVRPSDGEIFVGGTFQPAGSSQVDMAVARFNANGGLDGVQTITPTGGSYNEVWGMAVQPDGKVLLGGDIDNGSPTYDDFAVVRLNAAGTAVDPTFGNGGFAAVSLSNGGDRGFGLALQPDGRIVVAGSSYGGNSTSQFAAARFTASGQLDTSFGSGGTVQTSVPGDSYAGAAAVAIQPDGKIILAGSASPAGTFPPAYDFALVRYTAAGALDPTFGSNGVVVRDFRGNDAAAALAVEPDGMILVAGNGGSNNGTLFARFLPDGTLDNSISYSGGGYGIKGMAIESNGRVVVTGNTSQQADYGFVDAYTGTAAVAASGSVQVVTTSNPVAGNDSYQVAKATTLVVAAPGVLGNDNDPSGQALHIQSYSSPSHGSLSLNPDGSFKYTPSGAYLGTDTFTYVAANANNTASNVATVTLTINGANDPPVATNDSYNIAVRNPGTTTYYVVAPGVLGNDTDPNGQAITAVLVGTVAHGTLNFRADGSFAYTPVAGYFGPDSFTYQASDGQALSNVATVSIQVESVPTAIYDTYSATENVPLTVAAPGVLGNDTDPAGLPLHPVVSSYPAHGTLTMNSDGSFRYVPDQNTSGTDSFSYYVTNGTYRSDSIADTIDVAHVNQPPVAVADSYSVDEDGTLSTAPAVTQITMTSQSGDYIGQGKTYNFTPANASFSAFVYSSNSVSYGNAVVISAATGDDHFLYEFQAPNQARLTPGTYTGATQFPFAAANTPGLDVSGDGRNSNTLTGQFTVYQALYDDSGNILAFAADFTLRGDGASAALTGRVLYHSSFTSPEGVLFNDTDPDNDALNARLVAGAGHGSVSLNADGSFRYVPLPGYSGTDQFSYVANDGQLDSNVATVTIAVNQARLVDDPSFENVRVGTGGSAYSYDPTGSAWTFAGSAGLAGDGSAFTAGNPNAPDGTQVAFLQQTGSITQTLYGLAAGTYQVNLLAAQRGNVASNQAVNVLVDGVIVGAIRPTGTTYAAYSSPSFTVGAGSHTIALQGTTTANDYTAFVDGVAVVAAPTPPAGTPTVGDAGFEAVAVGSGGGAYSYDPTGSAWTFAGSAGLAGNGSAFTGGNPAAPGGAQVAFLQQTGSITQTVANWAAGTYTLSVLAAQRANMASNQAIQVLIDGALVGTIRPTGTTYAAYTTPTFAVAAGSHTITIRGTTTANDYTAFVDDVRVDAAPAPAAPTPGDAGFEAVAVGSGGGAYSYDPTGSAWTFAGSAGLAGNGSGFTAGNPAAPEGGQVAFLQQTGSITQTVANWAAGSYVLSLSAAQRANVASNQVLQVLIDGVLVGTIRPTGTAYATYTTPSFAVAAGSHSITIRGTTTADDYTAFVDNIAIAPASSSS